MARRGSGTVTIRILGEVAGLRRGLSEADDSLRSFGDRVGDVGKKMTLFATVPIVGFLGAATKAAVDDAAAQAHLATTLENAVGASDKVVAGVEKQITAFQKVSTFTDDELRPAFESLARSSGSVEKATGLLAVAMDVAAGKGIPLETATLAVAKASEGQFAAVNKLVPGLLDLSDKSLTVETATAKLAALFDGQASAATDTVAGKAANFKRDLGELSESIGTVLLPILTKLVDFIQPLIEKFSNMSSGTQTAIVVVGLLVAAIGPLIGLLTSLGVAFTFLAANPIVLIIAAFALLVAGLVRCYQESQTFRDVVNKVFETVANVIGDAVGLILDYFATWIGAFATVAEAAAKIPIIGDQFDGVADTIRGAEHTLRGWADTAHKGIDLVTNDAERLDKNLKGIMTTWSKMDLKALTSGTAAEAGFSFPGRAHGGPVSAGRGYTVGERGPELFVPGQSGSIVPGGAGGPITIQVAIDRRVLAQVTAESLRDLQRRSGNLGFISP